MGLGIMVFSRKMQLRAAFVGAVLASAVSSNVIAAPSIPPGFSAAVFDVNIDAGYNQITNISIFTQTNNNTGYSRYFTANPGSDEFFALVPPQGGVIQSAFAAGVIAGLPGDPAGAVTNHLVVFGDFTSADLGESFASLFPGVDENTLINDLLTTPNTSPFPSLINTFTADAKADGLYGGNDTDIDAVAFSGGTVIGDGTITLLPKHVPEPMSIAVFVAGLAGLTAMTLRKRARRT
jgi:hypothetical protein